MKLSEPADSLFRHFKTTDSSSLVALGRFTVSSSSWSDSVVRGFRGTGPFLWSCQICACEVVHRIPYYFYNGCRARLLSLSLLVCLARLTTKMYPFYWLLLRISFWFHWFLSTVFLFSILISALTVVIFCLLIALGLLYSPFLASWCDAVVWMSVFPQNAYMEVLTPEVMVLGERVFERWRGHEGGALTVGSVPW